jgi:hypothetical protein
MIWYPTGALPCPFIQILTRHRPQRCACFIEARCLEVTCQVYLDADVTQVININRLPNTFHMVGHMWDEHLEYTYSGQINLSTQVGTASSHFIPIKTSYYVSQMLQEIVLMTWATEMLLVMLVACYAGYVSHRLQRTATFKRHCELRSPTLPDSATTFVLCCCQWCALHEVARTSALCSPLYVCVC